MVLKAIDYLPILTTLFSAYFLYEIYNHYKVRKKTYLLWWTIGVLSYGLGTVTESIHALAGWNEVNLKLWYIAGALLGGFPLAQGSVYLLMNRKFANISTGIVTFIILLASLFVILTPVTIPEPFDGKLSGSVFAWGWVRIFPPFINTYALIFLVGGAVYSAIKYYRHGQREAPFKGNIYIAVGGLLPGIGGTFARMDHVQVLFVTELTGILLMYFGYRIIRKDKGKVKVVHAEQQVNG